MNRTEAEDYVYKSYLKAERHQDYHAKDADKRRPDLTRKILRDKAGTPCVVVTGSKGKGSVSNMISQILQTELSVGLMTSPHLVDFCERFKVNGVNISDEDFAEQMSRLQPEIDAVDSVIPESVCISPMGIQADLALSYFAANKTDFNVFECGKGAKYDDVNNVKHDYAVINNIFPEHTRELGETVKAIAGDKSYVITGEQKCVFVADQPPEVLEVIEKRALEFNTPLKIYGRDFKAENVRYSQNGMVFDVVIGDEVYTDLTVPLLGEHQTRNCALALALCREILGTLDTEAVKRKLREIDWPGRMEVISSDPFIMLDACINSASCHNVKAVIANMGITDCTVIIGIPDDKDYAGVVRSMSEVATDIILTKSQNPHYVFTSKQSDKMAEEGIAARWTASVRDAVDTAKGLKKPIVILGTTSVVSEVKKLRITENVIIQ